jgi:hypothetical protein
MWRQLRFAAEGHAPGHRSLSPFAGPGQDQRSFELSKATEYREHEPTMRRGGISPSIGERSKASTGLRYCVQDVEKVTSASRQAVKASDQKNVASRKGSYRLGQLATISDSAADLLAEEPLSASRSQRSLLSIQGLSVSADASVSDDHWLSSHAK